jgi:hypothetical protein
LAQPSQSYFHPPADHIQFPKLLYLFNPSFVSFLRQVTRTAYVFRVDFEITISVAEESPTGYLFLCPTKDFLVGPGAFRWPDCPAYWSLDPSGMERLNVEEATGLGFPPIRLNTKIKVWYWDGSVYAGLRQFHQGKGFNPDSLDLARHLGLPLYDLSAEMDPPPFAHGESKIPEPVVFLSNNL